MRDLGEGREKGKRKEVGDERGGSGLDYSRNTVKKERGAVGGGLPSGRCTQALNYMWEARGSGEHPSFHRYQRISRLIQSRLLAAGQ